MEQPRHKPLTPRKSQALSSLDNRLVVQGHRGGLSHSTLYQDENDLTFKHHQSSKPNSIPSLTLLDDDRIQKENRPPVLRQNQRSTSSSGHRYPGYSSTGSSDNAIQVRPSAPPRRMEQTRCRPTEGGKTVSLSVVNKVNQSYHNNIDNVFDEKHDIKDNKDHRQRRHLIEQRMSPEQLKLLSRRIDPSLPVSPHGSPSKPALPSIFTTTGKMKPKSTTTTSSSFCRLSSLSSSLYQTCIDLWPSEPTLGDFASDNIKNLTDLLKVRLSQAKYRILAQLELEEQQESQGKDCTKMYPTISSAAKVLRDDEIDYSTWPTFQKHTIDLSSKRSQSDLCVSGNGQHLFRHRDAYMKRHRIKQQQQQQQQHLKYLLDCSSPSIDDRTDEIRHVVSLPPPSSPSASKTDTKRKRRAKPKTADSDSPRDEGRIQASLVSPVKLENGSQIYVCVPCDKKYKTRNGLAYHFNRCPSMPSAPPPPVLQQMETTQSQEQPITEQQQASPSLSSGSKSSGVNCVCDHPTDDEKMMVQCDECQLWLHLDCVGTNDGVLDDIYNCPRCTDRLGKRRRLDPSPQRQDVASLIFDQLNNTPTSGLSVDQQPSTVPENKPTPPVWDDLLDAGQTTTTPSVSNNKNHNNDVNMWGMSTADIPSLLYSDAMTSTLDDDLPYLMDLPSSDLSPHDLPPTDWFQFANFDDDFHCDDSQTTQ